MPMPTSSTSLIAGYRGFKHVVLNGQFVRRRALVTFSKSRQIVPAVTKQFARSFGPKRSYTNINRLMATDPSSETNANVVGVEDRSKCIFCKIVDGKEENEIYYQDDEIVVFQDIKPASKYHLLVVPREHIRDCKTLVPSQLGLVDKLIQVGNQVLKEQLQKDGGGSPEEIQILRGFHWPPFHTVSHLHLHVIAPSDQMGFMARTIFRPGSWWFVTSDYVRDRLQKMDSGS